VIGEKVGDYRCVARLGAGWSGEVYRALDLVHGREVAVRLLGDGFECAPDEVARFRGQALSLSRLRHPALAAVHDFRWVQQRGLFVMELLAGESLKGMIPRGGLPWEQVLRWMASPLEGIELAHRAGIIHLDLKPNNFTRDADSFRVMDFGVGRLLLPGCRREVPPRPMGSAAHRAPEQVRGFALDRRTDIYALGCVLYEMLSGQPPFERDSEEETLRAHVEEPAPPLRRSTPVPDWLDSAVQRALAKRPEDRFQSVRELRYRLLPREGMPDRRRQASPTWHEQPIRQTVPSIVSEPISTPWAFNDRGVTDLAHVGSLPVPVKPLPEPAREVAARESVDTEAGSDRPAAPPENLASTANVATSLRDDTAGPHDDRLSLPFEPAHAAPMRSALPSDNGLADVFFRAPAPQRERRTANLEDTSMADTTLVDSVAALPTAESVESPIVRRERSSWPAILAIGLCLAGGGGAALFTLRNRDVPGASGLGSSAIRSSTSPATTLPEARGVAANTVVAHPASAPTSSSDDSPHPPVSPPAASERPPVVSAPVETEHREETVSAATGKPVVPRPVPAATRQTTTAAPSHVARVVSGKGRSAPAAVHRSSARPSRPDNQQTSSRDRTTAPSSRWATKPVTKLRPVVAASTQHPSGVAQASLPEAPHEVAEEGRPTALARSTAPASSTSSAVEPEAAAPRTGRSLAELVSVADELRDHASELRRLYRTYLQTQAPGSIQADHEQQALRHELEQFALATARFDEPLQEGSFKRFLRQVPGVSGALPAPTDEASFRSVVHDLSGRASRIDQLVSAVHPSHPFSALWRQTRASWQRARRLCTAS
jgi:serine/threonine protein kinase